MYCTLSITLQKMLKISISCVFSSAINNLFVSICKFYLYHNFLNAEHFSCKGQLHTQSITLYSKHERNSQNVYSFSTNPVPPFNLKVTLAYILYTISLFLPGLPHLPFGSHPGTALVILTASILLRWL